MARLEQMLASLHDALGVPVRRELPNGNGHLPGEDEPELGLVAAYRPTSVRFDPDPVSYRIAPGVPPPQLRMRRGGGTLLARLVIEAAFLVLVVVTLAALHMDPVIILAGGAGAWVAVLLVEFLLSRTEPRVVATHVDSAPPQAPAQPAPAPTATVGQPEVTPLPPEPDEPVEAYASEAEEDVWVVPHEYLVSDPIETIEHEDGEGQPVLLEDTLETDPPEPEEDTAESAAPPEDTAGSV